MRTSFIETLCEIAGEDKRVWLLCADLGYSVLEVFASRFPDRFVNVGVAEQNMIGIAAGLAMTDKIVFTYSMVNFSTLRCLEQIRSDLCYHNLSVKIVAVGAGFVYGMQGYTHHGLEDISIMRSLPNMTVIVPADSVESRLAIKEVVKKQGPCYIRLGKANEPLIHKTEPSFQIGKVIIVKDGTDFLIISAGSLLKEALEAAVVAEDKNISIAVWSMPYVKPIDRNALALAGRKYRIIVTVEEGQINGGLGSAVAEILSEVRLTNTRLLRLGVTDLLFAEGYDQEETRKKIGIDANSILKQILECAKYG